MRPSECRKFLIVGLGNPGEKYKYTRHNIGFLCIDQLCSIFKTQLVPASHGMVAEISHRGKKVTLLAPDTFMNLSGKAVQHWLQKNKVSIDGVLIITDDIHLTYQTIRLKRKGSDGGHNGLKNVAQHLNSSSYPRLRIGVGDDFMHGKQVEYVLNTWTEQEVKSLPLVLDHACKSVIAFIEEGLSSAMNKFNGAIKP